MIAMYSSWAAVHGDGRAQHPERSPSHADVARWLIAYELREAGEALSEPDAAERACRKLLNRLAKLIAPRGCQALLARALYLARTDFAFLAGINPAGNAGTIVDGFSRSAAGIDPQLAHRGLVALLETLIGLVALFVGEQLMTRMLREVWPDVRA